MTTELEFYLILERLAFEQDKSGKSAVADLVRDTMDDAWNSLSKDEQAFINNRIGNLQTEVVDVSCATASAKEPITLERQIAPGESPPKFSPQLERRFGDEDRRDGILGRGRGARSSDRGGWPSPPFTPPHEQRTGPVDRRHEPAEVKQSDSEECSDE